MHSSNQLKEKFDSFLENYDLSGQPSSLYEPIEYIMRLGGKRIRPILTLMSTEMFGADIEIALEAALALEVFHNFTLVHDDIMDAADTRRGKATVHKKFSSNVAILSGDAMLIKSYSILGSYTDPIIQHKLYGIFNKLAIEVCEGQEWDMQFETRNDVNVDEYINMISLKTGVLIAGSLKMGAVIAEADKPDQDHLYSFGKNIGIAFQLQDDLLDTFGEFSRVGKKIGGDIVQIKRHTYI